MELALKYKEALKIKLQETWYDDKYKFYTSSLYFSELELDKDTWKTMGYVSLNTKDEITGYIGYSVDRSIGNVTSLWAINFSSDKLKFGILIKQIIIDIFIKFNLNKINFTVIVGNPVEKSYDKMVLKFGGSIVGIYKNHVKLFDNKYYDEKVYEILKDSFIY